MPKLIDALSAMTGEMLPFHGTEELLEQLGIGVNIPWDLLANNGFTHRVISERWCTDQPVGEEAIYYNGVLIAMTAKSSRYAVPKYRWVSQQHADQTYNVVMNLAREFMDAPEITLLDAEEMVDTHYQIPYHENLMPHHLENTVVRHKGRLANIVSFAADPNSRFGDKVYRLRYQDDGWCQEGVKLKDITFPYPWAPQNG
jgi:hypothetical protein